MRCIGKDAHVHIDLGNDDLRDGIREPRDRGDRRGRFLKRDHRLPDLNFQRINHLGQPVGLLQKQLHHERMMVGEASLHRVNELGDLGPHPAQPY